MANSIRLSLGRGWIYLNRSEEKTIRNCINLLEHANTRDNRLHTEAFCKALKLDRRTIGHTLMLLVAIGVLRVQQYGRMRLYGFTSGYKTKLKQKTRRL